jgi:hypothetical protein
MYKHTKFLNKAKLCACRAMSHRLILGRGKHYFLHSVLTGSGTHPTFYTTCAGEFSLHQRGRGLKLCTDLHLVQKLKVLELYIHFLSICGVVINYLSPGIE